MIALPLLLDREVDFVTAMITSFQYVMRNPVVMLGWGVFIAVVTFVALSSQITVTTPVTAIAAIEQVEIA